MATRSPSRFVDRRLGMTAKQHEIAALWLRASPSPRSKASGGFGVALSMCFDPRRTPLVNGLDGLAVLVPKLIVFVVGPAGGVAA